MTGTVAGRCDPHFEAVRAAFADSLAQGDDHGAAVAVVADGMLVVDLWGGWADQAGTVPWQADTMVHVASATKGILAVALHRLVDRGLVDLDAPVATYWPEFAAANKGSLRVRNLLDHTAGLAAFQRTMRVEDLFDWDLCTGALAAQEPLWSPGAGHGYHALTFGWLVGELVRRAGAVTPATLIAAITDHYAGGEIQVGVPATAQRHIAEMGPYVVDAQLAATLRRTDGPGPSLPAQVFTNPVTVQNGLANTTSWRAAIIPAANGHATARGLARLYGTLVTGKGPLAPETVRRCSVPAAVGRDLVLGVDTCFSLGFMKGMPYATASAFGHPGAGGSLGYCDPDAEIGFGYVMNRAEPTLYVGRRATRLLAALYDCLGVQGVAPAGEGALRNAVGLR
jgi:CubicO group peptidase (beta-lactamase class C family)